MFNKKYLKRQGFKIFFKISKAILTYGFKNHSQPKQDKFKKKHVLINCSETEKSYKHVK